MTDRERIEKTYAKVKKKYPDVTDKEEIDALAIKHEKRFSLLCCLGLLAGAVLSFALAYFIKNETFEETRYILILGGGYLIFEIFRILSKYSKIEKMYHPVETVSYQGVLTQEKILKDGGRTLKKADGQFVIVKLPLFDKEDETEVGLNNTTYHVFRLYFEINEQGRRAFVKVKENDYINGVIGAMYYVVLSPENEIVAAYQASNWELESGLGANCKNFDMPVQAEQSPYAPTPVVKTTEKEKTKVLLPLLSVLLIILSYLMPMYLGIPLAVAALVVGIVALTKQRSTLSMICMFITFGLFALLGLSIAVLFFF